MDMNDASVQELVEELVVRAKQTNGFQFVTDCALYMLESAIRDEHSVRWGGNTRK